VGGFWVWAWVWVWWFTRWGLGVPVWMAGAAATPAATQIPRRRQTDGRWTIDSTAHISISNQLPSPLVWKKVQSKCTTHSLPGAASGEQVNQAGGVAGGRIRKAGPRT